MSIMNSDYEIGQTLWTIKNCKVVKFTVASISVHLSATGQTVFYFGEGSSTTYPEDECFTSREALIEQL